MQTLYYIVLVPMVYVSFVVFILGTAIRLVKIFREPANPTSLQMYPERRPAWLWALYDTFLFPTVLKHKPLLWIFLMFFHISFVLLLIGHLELIRDFAFFQVIPHEIFLGKGFIGLIMAISLLYFLIRRFSSPVRELSVPEDYFLLILLFLTVLFGSEMDWARRWYGYDTMSVDSYREYLFSIFTFNPELPYEVTDSGHSFMLVLHVFFANLFLIFFPFSQAMHSFLSLPMNKLRRG
ncbi:respiratory nitrate reductase subunit gamma [Deltaproteobacteria bacterium]|nr:respiratory nitrate reductase subunit gamma [Deltaproteobacteria bacterium]